MENEIIAPLVKVKVGKGNDSGCCGGAPTANADACCQLDEVKKAEGEAGCGCGTSATSEVAPGGCC